MSDDRFAAARDQFTAGLGFLQAGQLQQAETALRASLALLPGRPSTLTNLAVALLRQGRADEALPLLDEALAAQPDDIEALGHRGVVLNQLRRPAEAGPCFERLVQLAPGRVEAWYHLGQTWQVLNQPAHAVSAYDRCLALRSDHGPTWSQRGTALRELGQGDDAAASFERALALGDDPALNAYYLAAVRGGAAPQQAPTDYVQRLFDDYAPDFDQHLVEVLGYCAPERLQQLVVGLGLPTADSALDLGCGTGLCGPLLRPLAHRLVGVDLSAVMLDAARTRGVYDELLQADIAEHLYTTTAQHDLVVAADVFIYIGDLAPVFAGVRRVLRPGGVFAFSVEPAAPDQAWVLRPSLRFAHGEQAVRAWASGHGMTVRRAERAALRVDQGEDGVGQYWVLTL